MKLDIIVATIVIGANAVSVWLVYYLLLAKLRRLNQHNVRRYHDLVKNQNLTIKTLGIKNENRKSNKYW